MDVASRVSGRQLLNPYEDTALFSYCASCCDVCDRCPPRWCQFSEALCVRGGRPFRDSGGAQERDRLARNAVAIYVCV